LGFIALPLQILEFRGCRVPEVVEFIVEVLVLIQGGRELLFFRLRELVRAIVGGADVVQPEDIKTSALPRRIVAMHFELRLRVNSCILDAAFVVDLVDDGAITRVNLPALRLRLATRHGQSCPMGEARDMDIHIFSATMKIIKP
jgi:hypothetical protein